MQKMNEKSVLLYEEKRTALWFSILFYIILVGYDIFFYFIYPSHDTTISPGFPNKFVYLIYLVMALLIPLLILNNKRNKQYLINFYIFYTFAFLIFVNDVITYWDKSELFSSGNAVEVFIVLFSLIFVNKRFF